MGLAGDDLPITVSLQPRVGDVVTRRQVLAEYRLRLVGIITKYGGVADNPALDVADFDCAGITSRQRSDVSDEPGFIERPAFLVGEDAVVGEYFFQGAWFAGTMAS
jgi:hypothetical protein